MSTLKEPGRGGRVRRTHSAAFKAQVVAACSVPGVSTAAVALAHGINDNLARRWVQAAAQHTSGALTVPVKPAVAAFVPVQLPAPGQPALDIRIELRRGATAISVSWPCTASAACAAWMRELLK